MRITLPSGTPAALARPDGSAAMGLVVAPDIFGLRPLYDDLVARLAHEWSMVVCAVEPFPGQDLGPTLEERFDAVGAKQDEASVRDLTEAADVVSAEITKGSSGASAAPVPVGLLGFCMGGMYAFKAASLGRFDRVVAFYGMIRIPDAWQGPGHAQPLDLLAAAGASNVLAIIGGLDHYTPPADVDALEPLPNVTVVRYPDAEHGFAHDASRPAHRAADAADAFKRAERFLLSATGA
jgi:carboxymethylenebutenolidase